MVLVKWFLLVVIAFLRHLQGSIGIKCVTKQFLASQDLIVDMIFEWLEFLVEVQTEKYRKTREKPKATTNFKFGTGFFRLFFSVIFFGFFWVATPPPPKKASLYYEI